MALRAPGAPGLVEYIVPARFSTSQVSKIPFSPLYDGDIAPFHDQLVPVIHKALFRRRVFGENHDSRSAPVQTVYDGGSAFGIRSPDMVCYDIVETFDSRSFGGDDRKSFGFFDDDDILVFEEKINGTASPGRRNGPPGVSMSIWIRLSPSHRVILHRGAWMDYSWTMDEGRLPQNRRTVRIGPRSIQW